MKKLFLILFILFSLKVYPQEVIADFEKDSVSILNEELRKLREDIRTNASGVAANISTATECAFLARPSAPQNNIAVGSAVTIVLGNEIKDLGDDFASNTFTAPVDAMYALTAFIGLVAYDTAGTEYALNIVTSNRNYAFGGDAAVYAADGRISFTAAVIADMDAGDTAYLQVTQSAGTQQTDIYSHSQFSGALFFEY